VFLVILIAGCGCKGVGLNRVSPADQTIRVGESVTVEYKTGGGCVNGNHLTDVELDAVATVWHTVDSLVVGLDTLTGRVTARAPGEAWVVSGGGSGARIHVR
jgi:hypothetical protein